MKGGGLGTARPTMLPPKTRDALKTGKPWRILMLGDSIMQDTFHSQFHSLVVHSGELGKQLIARIALAYFIAAAL